MGVNLVNESGNDDYILKEPGGELPDEPLLDETKGLSGNITDINLLEIVQFFSLTQKTKALEIYFGGRVGQFFIESGQLVHAVSGAVSGEDAVYLCLSSKESSFKEIAWRLPEERTVTTPTSALLLDVVSRLDEEKENRQVDKNRPDTGESAWRANCLSEIGRIPGIEGALLVTRATDKNSRVVTAVNSTGSHTERLRAIVQFFSGLSGKLATATRFEKLQNILIRSREGHHIMVCSFRYGVLCAALRHESLFDSVQKNILRVLALYEKK